MEIAGGRRYTSGSRGRYLTAPARIWLKYLLYAYYGCLANVLFRGAWAQGLPKLGDWDLRVEEDPQCSNGRSYSIVGV